MGRGSGELKWMGGSLRGCVDVVVFIVFILERGGQGRSKGSVWWRSHRKVGWARRRTLEKGVKARKQRANTWNSSEVRLKRGSSLRGSLLDGPSQMPNAVAPSSTAKDSVVGPNVRHRILCLGMLIKQEGLWCSGITPAQHVGGPGFNPLRAHALN